MQQDSTRMPTFHGMYEHQQRLQKDRHRSHYVICEEYSPQTLALKFGAEFEGQNPGSVDSCPFAQGLRQVEGQGEPVGTENWGGQVQLPNEHCNEKPQSALLAHCRPADSAATELAVWTVVITV